MTPRTSEQYKEIRESKRSLIMESALKLFAKHGVYSTTINMIAQDAGISKGLMYNYFSSKEELLKSIIVHGLNEFMQFIDPDEDGILTKDELKYFFNQNYKVIQNNIQHWKLYFSVMYQPQILKLVHKEFMQLLVPMYRIMTNYFTKNGYKNPKFETKFLIAILDGISLNYLNDPEHFPLDKAVKKLINMYT